MELVITNQELFDNRSLLPQDIKEQWANELKSGKWEQGKFYLCSDNKYCCLGVLVSIQNRPSETTSNEYYKNHLAFDGSDDSIRSINPLFKVLGDSGDFNGFKIDTWKSLAGLNDSGNYSFEQIAEVIEKYF